MPKVFISYKSQHKDIAAPVQQFLYSNLIDTWLDSDALHTGDELTPDIRKAIKDRKYFIAFLSIQYLASDWCKEEIRLVRKLYEEDKKSKQISLVLLNKKEELEAVGNIHVNALLNHVRIISFDGEKKDNLELEHLAKILLEDIWANEEVSFFPVKNWHIDSLKIQEIAFKINVANLPANFLETWDMKLSEFIATHQNDNNKQPIKDYTDIAFSGKGPIWLYTFLIAPLANKRNIFVFTKYEEEDCFICVYAKGSKMIGKVILRKDLEEIESF